MKLSADTLNEQGSRKKGLAIASTIFGAIGLLMSFLILFGRTTPPDGDYISPLSGVFYSSILPFLFTVLGLIFGIAFIKKHKKFLAKIGIGLSLISFLIILINFAVAINMSGQPQQLTDNRFNGKFVYRESVVDYMIFEFDGTNKASMVITRGSDINTAEVRIHISPVSNTISMRLWGTGSYIYESVPFSFREGGNVLVFNDMRFEKE